MLKRTSAPPTVGTTKPRNDFGPAEYLMILDRFSRQRATQVDRLSSITKLRGI